MSDNNGGILSNFYGLLGLPNDDEVAKWRRKYGLQYVPQPSPMASIGRGFADVWEPLKQSYLNLANPTQAAAYQQQRAEDERLYQRGRLSASPVPTGAWAQAHPDQPPELNPANDIWRMLSRTAPAGVIAPIMPATLPEAAMSTMLTSGVYDALGAARQRAALASWLELPNPFR